MQERTYMPTGRVGRPMALHATKVEGEGARRVVRACHIRIEPGVAFSTDWDVSAWERDGWIRELRMEARPAGRPVAPVVPAVEEPRDPAPVAPEPVVVVAEVPAATVADPMPESIPEPVEETVAEAVQAVQPGAKKRVRTRTRVQGGA